MITVLAILGIIFIFFLIGFFTSQNFKEYQSQKLSKNKSPYLSKQTINSGSSYYSNIDNIRTDGYYILKGGNYIYVYALLSNGQVAWFSEFVSGNSIAESLLLTKSIHETIANSKVWAKENSIENNEIISVFEIGDKTKIIRGKLKSNGQLQVFKTFVDYDGQKVTEWYDYDFEKYVNY